MIEKNILISYYILFLDIMQSLKHGVMSTSLLNTGKSNY